METDARVLKTGTYLVFTLIGDTGKTKIVQVTNKAGIRLGKVKWLGAWRKYCFMPEGETMFDSGCLGEVIEFISLLIKERQRAEALKKLK